MGEKKLEDAESLEDSQLEDVSGGSRILTSRVLLNATDSDGATLDADDEELDGRRPPCIGWRPVKED